VFDLSSTVFPVDVKSPRQNPRLRHGRKPFVSLGEMSSQSTLTIILVNIKIHRIRDINKRRSFLMYVCLCTGVTDGKIRDAIYEGCCSYKEVRLATGVASQCGKCACLAKEVVRETLMELQTAQAAIPFPAEFTAA
jgi:bacterioferritin-associated ferredoxin